MVQQKQETPGIVVRRKRGAGDGEKPMVEAVNVIPIKGGLPVEVIGADETYANSVHIQIIDLMKTYEETYFDLARKLYEVKEKKLYRALDQKYDTFQQYVEAIGIDYRKSKYLTRMWWWYGIEQNANPKLLEGAQEIGWCLHPETLVTTIGGTRPIWSVSPGDTIMDESGGWTEVVENMVFGFDDAFKIKAVKCGELIASEGHGFDAIRGGVRIRRDARVSKKPFEYQIERVNAENLCVGDMLIVPAVVPTDPGEFGKKSEDFFEFAGWYVSEGFTYGGQLRISLGVEAENERDRIYGLAESVFSEATYSLQKNGGRETGSFRVTVSGGDIDFEFDEWFGVGAGRKKFPYEFYSLSEAQIKAFIRGLHHGDGARSEKGTHVIWTTSRSLAYQVRTLLTRLGVLAGVFRGPRDEKEHGKREDIWVVTLGKADAEKVLGRWGNEVLRPYAHYISIKEGFAVPVRSVETVEVNGPLVHLETKTGRFCCPVVSYNTKAKELIEIIDGRNASRWFKLAKQMNAVDLGRAARVAKKKADETKRAKAKAKSQDKGRESRDGISEAYDELDEKKPKGAKLLDPKSPKPAQVALPIEAESQGEPVTAGEAEEITGIDVPDDIEDRVASQKRESEKWKRYHFDVHMDNWDTINNAFHFAGDLAESDHKGHIFSLICLHYNSFHDGQKSVVIGEWLAQLERLSGLSLVALDRKTDEIVYGAELIEELASKEEGDGDDGEPGAGD